MSENEPNPFSHTESVGEEVTKTLLSVPATYVNRFFMTGLGPNVRLTFGEQNAPNGEVALRAAIFMTVADVLQLKALIDHITKDVQLLESPTAERNG